MGKMLSSTSSGVQVRPFRIFLHSPDGVGKTTFAAGAPRPIFADVEGGTTFLSTERVRITRYADLVGLLKELHGEEHQFQTLVLDTVDWLEPLLWASFLGGTEIEKYDGGYGKGYVAALDVWRSLLRGLEALQEKRGMHVVLLAHSQLKIFKNPVGDDFDRYSIKMNEKAAALLRDWCYGVYFAHHQVAVDVKGKGKEARRRGVSTGARVMESQWSAAWDAKDRYGLPEKSIPLSWADFVRFATKGGADLADLAVEITRKAAELGGEYPAKAKEVIRCDAKNRTRLEAANNQLNTLLAEQTEPDAQECPPNAPGCLESDFEVVPTPLPPSSLSEAVSSPWDDSEASPKTAPKALAEQVQIPATASKALTAASGDLARMIARASTLDELDKLVPALQALPDLHRDAIRPIFAERKSAILASASQE